MDPLIFAFAAMLAWGIGDFLIQRVARKTSSLETLCFIGIVSVVGLFPFVVDEITALAAPDLVMLSILGIITFIAAMLNIESFRAGKLAVMDVVLTFELPITVMLGMVLLSETLTTLNVVLIIALLVGLVLVSIEGKIGKLTLERGIYLALLGAIAMGFANFLTAQASRAFSPMMAIWFPAIIFTVLCLCVMSVRGTLPQITKHVRSFGVIIAFMAVIDTAAWVFYAYALESGHVGITTAITESYPVIAVILGASINRERIAKHQWLGVALALACSILLAVT